MLVAKLKKWMRTDDLKAKNHLHNLIDSCFVSFSLQLLQPQAKQSRKPETMCHDSTATERDLTAAECLVIYLTTSTSISDPLLSLLIQQVKQQCSDEQNVIRKSATT